LDDVGSYTVNPVGMSQGQLLPDFFQKQWSVKARKNISGGGADYWVQFKRANEKRTGGSGGKDKKNKFILKFQSASLRMEVYFNWIWQSEKEDGT